MRQWIEDARQGDPAAWDNLVRHFRGMAYTVAYSKLRDSHLAEDAAQEAFAEAFAHLGRLQDADAFPGWFRIIVERQCYRFLRRKKHALVPIHEAEALPGDDSSAESAAEWNERIAALRRSVDGLPPSLRLAVRLFYFQGYSIREISGYLGISASALKKRLFDARSKLRTSLLVSDLVSAFNDLYQGEESMLHIVNGDHVGDKLRQGKIQGDVLVWREIYPIGPVFEDMARPSNRLLRARYLERTLGIPESDYVRNCESQERVLQGFRQYDEVVLWFEHDLFDQTMLCYLLQWFARQPLGKTKLNLLCIGDYPGVGLFRGMGQLTSEQLSGLSGTWRRLGKEELALGSALWKAYASKNVEDHLGILSADTSALPFAKATFAMHAARFPAPANGLGIVEQTVLELAKDGTHTFSELFKEAGEQLHTLGMGDLEFGYRLRTLAEPPCALLELKGASAFPDALLEASAPLPGGTAALTDLGREVLAGERDWVKERGMDEWYGGLHLHGEPGWRWDRRENRLIKP